MRVFWITGAAVATLAAASCSPTPSVDSGELDRLETRVGKLICAKKRGRFSEDQCERFAAGVRERVASDSFDEARVTAFLTSFEAAAQQVVSPSDEPADGVEFDLELAVTQGKVGIFLEKETLDASERERIDDQIETLHSFTGGILRERLAGLDAPVFARLFSELKMDQGTGATDPIAALLVNQRIGLTRSAQSRFHYAFRRPLTDEELEQVQQTWRQRLETNLPAVIIADRIAQWTAQLELVDGDSEEARTNAQVEVAQQLSEYLFPARSLIAYDVKLVMKPEPTEAERAAIAAFQKANASS